MKKMLMLLLLVSLNATATVLQTEAICEGALESEMEEGQVEKIKLSVAINPNVWCGATDDRAALVIHDESAFGDAVVLATKTTTPAGKTVVTATGDELLISIEYTIEGVPGFGTGLLNIEGNSVPVKCSFLEYDLEC